MTVRCAYCGAEAEAEGASPAEMPRGWVELRWHDAGSLVYVVWRACTAAHAQRIMRRRGEDMGHVPPHAR